MGIVIPRPPLRAAGSRRIRARLARHAEIMAELEADGMSREAASAEAYVRVIREIPR
jgi:hypothetical protein